MKTTVTPSMREAMNRKATLRPGPIGKVLLKSPIRTAITDPFRDFDGPSQKEWKFTIPGIPLGKPRMTQRDRWQKRKCVVKFRAWADVARAHAPMNLTDDPLTVSWTAFLPLPASWSKAKRAAHLGTLHRQKPDRDNIDKGILDALFPSDCGVAGGTIVKRWDDGKGPRLEIHVTSL